MQTSRTILAFGLSLAVLFIYYTWIAPPVPRPSSSNKSDKSAEAVPVSPQGNISGTPAVSGDIFPSFESSGEDTSEKQASFDTDEVQALISDQGVLSSWVLKKFTPLVDILGEKEKGVALYLTTDGLPPEEGWGAKGVSLAPDGSAKEYQFEGKRGGLRIQKVLSIDPQAKPYAVEVVVTLINEGKETQTMEPRLWMILPQKRDTQEKKGFFSFLRPPPNTFSVVSYRDGKVETSEKWDKLARKTEKRGKVYWTGLSDRYFLMSLVSRQEGDNIPIQYGKDGEGRIYTSLSYGDVSISPGERIIKRFSAYLGPKKRDELLKMSVHLEKSVNYGWFDFAAVPILWLLIFFHKIVANWGVAIILSTFFIKLLLHPVNVKAMRSMREMQKVQPELNLLKEKYGKDRERLNMEMMALFKRHKVNPMGGCLPMLLQMPIYIALYNVLYNAIELYHAPFFWFYRDLSVPDPYMVSPIILGVMMAAQQKLTPSTSMDPAQQKMMMIMPIMFSAFMIFLPSGLVIYILVNTVMSVVQQYLIHRDLSGIEVIKKVFAKKFRPS